jgi:signal transduction histidine kinase
MEKDTDLLSPTNSFFVRILYILIPFSTLVAIIYSVLIWASVSLTEDYIVKYYLQREFDEFEREYAQYGNLALVPNTSYLHTFWSANVELPAFAKALHEGLHEIGDTHILIKKMPGESNTIYMILDESKMSSLDSFAPVRMGLLWALAGLIIIAGGVVAIFMARLISAPVVQLAKDLSRQPFNAANLKSNLRKDEVGVLSRVISGALKHLEEARDRESAFTRHVSHELRTPLSTIRNSLAVIKLPHCAEIKRARNLQRLQHATGEMEDLIRLFLCLGREKVSPILISTHLLDVFNDALLRHKPKTTSLRIQLLVPSGLTISADPILLKSLIYNLINNAIQHGGQRLLIAANQNSLVVVNTLPGFESVKGYGYGLEIVSRICGYADWTLHIKSTPTLYSIRITGLG